MKLLSQCLDTPMIPHTGGGTCSSCILWILNILIFSKSIMIPYLLLNLRLPFKTSVKNKGFFFLNEDFKLYSTRWSPQIFTNCASFSYLLFRTESTQHKHVTSHRVIFCHFTSDKDFSSPITTFSPSKFLNISESALVSCQLILKVNSATNNLWYENTTWSF